MKNRNTQQIRTSTFLIVISMCLLWTSAFADIATRKTEVTQEMPIVNADIKTPQNESNQSLLHRYVTALKQQIQKNWNTSNIPQPFRCEIVFTQDPGGDVTSVLFSDCPDYKEAKQSIEKALLMEPMPYLGFEFVFQRKIAVTLCHPEKSCK